MSSTVMYIVESDGDVTAYKEFRNSHGGGAAVWSLLAKKYLGSDAWYMPSGTLDKLFAGREVMDDVDRLTLLSTADDVIVPRERVEEFAAAMEAFHERYAPKRVGMVFSIGDQAAAMRQALIDHPDARGICWNQTTVNGDAWSVYPPDEDEEAEDPEAYEDWDCTYNVDRHTGHTWLTADEK